MAPVMLDEQRGSGYCPFWACEHTMPIPHGQSCLVASTSGLLSGTLSWVRPRCGHLSLFVLVGGSIVMVVWLGLRASSSTLTCDIRVVDDARPCACSVRLPVLLLAFTLRASQVATEILDAR